MRKNMLLFGTLILTAAGFISRIIGFFYRIFLSRMFSTEQMGIYELIHPVLALTYAISTAGIQNAVSRFCAAQSDENCKKHRLHILLTGLFLSIFLSTCCSLAVYQCADFIAQNLLMEARCASLLRIIALSFPAACIHACINGYYYGIRKTGIPALLQLLEQLFRVGSVCFFWQYDLHHQIQFSISMAAVGMVIGEFSSCLFSLLFSFLHFSKDSSSQTTLKKNSLPYRPLTVSRQLLAFAFPLSVTRICLNLLSTLEAAWIPASLERFGLSGSQALSTYAVFTGMAMTCIFFPGAITNSVSVLLMPMIAKADAQKDYHTVSIILTKCMGWGLLMGIGCWAVFFTLGRNMGIWFFNNASAGEFIRTLSFLCPVLYLNSTLVSIQNGLGKTGLTFLCSLCALGIRLFFVLFLIPVQGISGYLWGLFASQIFTAFFHIYTLNSFIYTQRIHL